MRGRDNYLAVQREYPEGWHIEVLRIVDGGDTVVSEVRVDQEGQRFFAASFFELADGRISRAVEYWSDGEPARRRPSGAPAGWSGSERPGHPPRRAVRSRARDGGARRVVGRAAPHGRHAPSALLRPLPGHVLRGRAERRAGRLPDRLPLAERPRGRLRALRRREPRSSAGRASAGSSTSGSSRSHARTGGARSRASPRPRTPARSRSTRRSASSRARRRPATTGRARTGSSSRAPSDARAAARSQAVHSCQRRIPAASSRTVRPPSRRRSRLSWTAVECYEARFARAHASSGSAAAE